MSIFAILSTAATGGAVAPENQVIGQVLMFGLIFVIFYFLIIRPQQKKYKQHMAMVSAVERGDKVVTAGGIVGKVTKLDADNGHLAVEIASGVEVKVVASTISNVISDRKTASNDNKTAPKTAAAKKKK